MDPMVTFHGALRLSTASCIIGLVLRWGLMVPCFVSLATEIQIPRSTYPTGVSGLLFWHDTGPYISLEGRRGAESIPITSITT